MEGELHYEPVTSGSMLFMMEATSSDLSIQYSFKFNFNNSSKSIAIGVSLLSDDLLLGGVNEYRLEVGSEVLHSPLALTLLHKQPDQSNQLHR